MEVGILGAHQCETADRKFTSILIDGVLAVDAGSLASTLTLDEQLRVRDVLITHQHWDHTKDLAGFGFNVFNAGLEGARAPVGIHCARETRNVLAERLLVPGYWMDFFAVPTPERPTFAFHEVGPGDEFPLGPYRVRSVPINHSVPTMGYQVTDATGRSVYYTSDNGPGCGAAWATVEPTVLVTECTYSNEVAASGAGERHGHLWPEQLGAELRVFQQARGNLPRVVIVHVNPFYESRIAAEIADVSRQFPASIAIASEGQKLLL